MISAPHQAGEDEQDQRRHQLGGKRKFPAATCSLGYAGNMKHLIAALPLLALATPADAANRVKIPASEFAAAIRRADPMQAPGVNRKAITAKTIRVVRCIGPDDEPTEFQCTWLEKTGRGWKTHQSWLAFDARGWRLID